MCVYVCVCVCVCVLQWCPSWTTLYELPTSGASVCHTGNTSRPHTTMLSSYSYISVLIPRLLRDAAGVWVLPGKSRRAQENSSRRPKAFFFSRQSIVIASFRDGVRSKKLLVRTQLTIKKSHSSVRWSISSCASSLPPAGTCSPCRIRCTCFLCGSARR